jgi:hypothetical protein
MNSTKRNGTAGDVAAIAASDRMAWQPESTGGGCEALHGVAGGFAFLVTDEDATIPVPGAPVVVGIYTLTDGWYDEPIGDCAHMGACPSDARELQAMLAHGVALLLEKYTDAGGCAERDDAHEVDRDAMAYEACRQLVAAYDVPDGSSVDWSDLDEANGLPKERVEELVREHRRRMGDNLGMRPAAPRVRCRRSSWRG